MTDWNQFKGDPQHSGLRRDLEGPHRVSEAWSADLVGPVGSPVLDYDTVFVGTARGNLYAFDRKTGHRRWVFETLDAIDATPVVTDQHVYAGTDDGAIYALDLTTGDRVWQADLPPLRSALSASNGYLYVGHASGLSALEVETGEPAWTYATESPVVGCPAITSNPERVYAGTEGGRVHCLEATGDEVWTAPTDGAVTAGPTIADGRVYVGDDDGTLLALDVKTGQSWFSYEIQEPFTAAATVLPDEGTTFVGAADGYLHVTDTQFGRRKVRGWLFSKKGIALDGGIHASPVVAGDILCVGDLTGSIYGVDVTTFDLRWHFDAGGPISSTPALAPERLYVGGAERLLCLEWTPEEPSA